METVKSKPAYVRIREILRERILSSDTPVGVLSESRIIADFKVSATTAKKVLDELEDEGLVERKVGKGSFVIQSSEKSIKEFGILFFDIYNPQSPFINDIVRGIEERARFEHHYLHLYTTRNRPISENLSSSLFHLISKRKIDGLFLVSPLPADDLEFFRRHAVPFVSVSNCYVGANIPTVLFDHAAMLKGIAGRLLDLGCTRISLITGPRRNNGILRSGHFAFSGYREFLKKNALPYNAALAPEGEHSPEYGYRTMEQFALLPERERPHAVIAVSPPAAKGALKFLETHRAWRPLVIPYSDEKETYPRYVFAPFQKMGEAAFELLVKCLREPSTSTETVLVPLQLFFAQAGKTGGD
jgi:DNA-binding LacI/PurR family transcriptional regulator